MKIVANDKEMSWSWSLSSLSEGRISLSNDGEVAAHPHHRQQAEKKPVVHMTLERIILWMEEGSLLSEREMFVEKERILTQLEDFNDQIAWERQQRAAMVSKIEEHGQVLDQFPFSGETQPGKTVSTTMDESSIAVRSEHNENKRRKLKSKVWDEFTKYKGEDGMDWAVCSHCKREFDGSSKKGTTHLKNHLERCQAKRKGAGRDIAKSMKTRDLADINEKPVIDLVKNSIDANGMTTLQVDQEEKETGIVLRDQQNEKNGKRLKSKVWDEFTKYKGEDGMDWAKCSICEKEFDGSSKKGTTHLKNHLQRCRANYKRKGAGTGGDDE